MPNLKPTPPSPAVFHLESRVDVTTEAPIEAVHPGRNGVVPAGYAYAPDPAFLSRVLDRPVAAVRVAPIKKSGVPATVYRLQLQFQDGGQERFILKRVAPDWPGDPHGHLREARFYSHIVPRLDLPLMAVYYAGQEPDGEHQVVLLEDFDRTHYCPPGTYRWQMTDMATVIPTYARLHASGRDNLPPPAGRGWLYPRMETRITTLAAELPAMAAAVSAARKWPSLPHFSRLLSWLLAQIPAFQTLPPTILHMDVYPPNVALPRNGQDSAYLIDWDMVGFGLAELDLAFMFMQPHQAHVDLDREQVLALYWRERRHREGTIPSAAERKERQLYADALWAIWQIPTAYRLLANPFPVDSGPGRHWAGMYQAVGKKLLALSDQVG